jgi:hypothetical protein
MSAVPDIPTTTEEINRKALETLQNLVHGADTHKYTDSEVRVGVNALWGTVAGLCSNYVSQLIVQAINRFRGSLTKDSVTFVLPGQSVVKVIRNGTCLYIRTAKLNDELEWEDVDCIEKSFITEINPELAAQQAFHKAIEIIVTQKRGVIL